MRFATLDTPAGPRAVVRAGERYIDLAATDPGLPTNMRALLDGGDAAMAAARRAATSSKAVSTAAAEARYHAPVTDPHKIICLGLNYRDHALESGKAIPAEPVLFAKFATCLIGHGQSIVAPRVSQRVDYEAELVIVIGKTGRHISKEQAFGFVAGYAVGHDVSARDWQFKGETKQWLSGKVFDTFGPVGPELVTVDEAPDPHHLPIRLRLNGKVMQDSNTSQLIFGVPEILAYVSQILTLEPGDLIFTGTPPGVGDARKPPVYLKPGDVAEVEIEGLGVLRNPVVAEV